MGLASLGNDVVGMVYNAIYDDLFPRSRDCTDLGRIYDYSTTSSFLFSFTNVSMPILPKTHSKRVVSLPVLWSSPETIIPQNRMPMQ